MITVRPNMRCLIIAGFEEIRDAGFPRTSRKKARPRENSGRKSPKSGHGP